MAVESDQAAFVRAICERPLDDAPRLVYADWLEERGDRDPELALRAELIRVQIRIAAIPDCGHMVVTPIGRPHMGRRDDCERCRLVSRSDAILAGPARLGGPFGSLTWAAEWEGSLCVEWLGWVKGFAGETTLQCRTWEKYGPMIVAQDPIVEVRFSDRLPARRDFMWGWWANEGIHLRGQGPSTLPAAWFEAARRKNWILYATAEQAREDASRRAIKWAREQAGLPASMGNDAPV